MVIDRLSAVFVMKCVIIDEGEAVPDGGVAEGSFPEGVEEGAPTDLPCWVHGSTNQRNRQPGVRGHHWWHNRSNQILHVHKRHN